MLKALREEGKKGGLFGFEQAKNIYLEQRSFLEVGVITNSLKLQRFQARQKYKQVIEQLYAEGEIV